MAKQEAEPRGPGRPATGQTPKRYFRADDETWALIVRAAALSEETTSEYVRRVLSKDASRVVKSHG